MKPATLLVVRNAACLCPMDDARRVVLDEGAVAVRGDRIVAVGTNAEVDASLARPEFEGAEVETIDATNMLVRPPPARLEKAKGEAVAAVLTPLPGTRTVTPRRCSPG